MRLLSSQKNEILSILAQAFEPGTFSYVETLKKNGHAEIEISARDFPRHTFSIFSKTSGILYIIQSSGHKKDIQQSYYDDWGNVPEQLNNWITELKNKTQQRSAFYAIFDFVSQRLMPRDAVVALVDNESLNVKTETIIKSESYRESYLLCN